MTERVELEAVLSREECARIDRFCESCRGVQNLPRLAGFLHESLGTELVLDPDIVIGFAADSSNLPGSAQGVARPAVERECAAVFRACVRAGIPITVSGGKTNLTGSATPVCGVVVSTARMTAPPVAVDAASRTVTAPVGMLLEEMREAVRVQSGGTLIFPVDPTSRKEASVGGALACNASGFTPGETGAMRAWVESVRFLLPDGLLVSARRGQYAARNNRFLLAGAGDGREWPLPDYARPAIKNASGPWTCRDGTMDFVDLAVGSEGIFGLVTACRLRLAPRPPDYLDLFVSLPSETDALAFLFAARDHFAGDLSGVSAFEYFGVNCRRHMDHEGQFFRGSDPVGVYVQVPLPDGDMEEAALQWMELLKKGVPSSDESGVLLLDNDRLRALFLEARHSMPAHAVETVQRRGTYTIMTDTVVPPARFAEFLAKTHARLAADGLDYLAFGHLGDCHLHFTLLPEKERLDQAVAAYEAIVALAASLGGVYSGEHGTGKRKRKDFLRCYGPEAVEQLRRAKAAVDPEFLLNRGNVFE